MRIVFAVAALLLLSFNAQADKIPAESGLSLAGSPFVPSIGDHARAVAHSFAGGEGSFYMDFLHGYFGNIDFTAPEHSITFDWITGSAFTVLYGGPRGIDGWFQSYDHRGDDTIFRRGDLSWIDWTAGWRDRPGRGGVTSIGGTGGSATVPEPSTILLLALGLVGVVFTRRNRPWSNP